ncbi:hypothetical protein GCM10027062_28760 [Nocardioides hungaricus]
MRTNQLVLTVCTLGLLVVLGALAAASDGTTRDVVGLLGLAGVVAGLGLVTLDAWLRLPGPEPRMVTHDDVGAIRLQVALGAPVSLVLLTAGLTLVAVSFLLAPSLDDVSQGRRGGAWVYVVVVAAPLLLAGAVALLVRRDQLLLAPEVLVGRRLGRSQVVRWDQVREVEPVPGDPGLGLRIGAADGSSMLVPTRQLALTLGELAAVVRHLAATPADRPRLATAEALAMIDGLRRKAGRP